MHLILAPALAVQSMTWIRPPSSPNPTQSNPQCKRKDFLDSIDIDLAGLQIELEVALVRSLVAWMRVSIWLVGKE